MQGKMMMTSLEKESHEAIEAVLIQVVLGFGRDQYRDRGNGGILSHSRFHASEGRRR